MRMFISCLFIVVFSFSTAAQTADTSGAAAYIDDDLIVYMHAGPGRNYRILGTIAAGVPIQTLQVDSDAGFTQIEDTDSRKGWVETQYIINTVSRRAQMPLLVAQISKNEALIATLQDTNNSLKQQLSEYQNKSNTLNTQLQQGQRQIKELEQQLDAQDSEERYRMFSYGGIVAGVGVLLGVILMALPKRRRREDTWM